MIETLIPGAPSLILLAKVGHLDLLLREGRDVLVPDAVADEVLAGPEDDPARTALTDGWGQRVETGELPDSVAALGVGRGEASVLAAALGREGCVVVLDDDQARRAARRLGITPTGTLGVILSAKRHGRIPLAAPVIARLRAAGMYLDDATVRKALAGVGEAASDQV